MHQRPPNLGWDSESLPTDIMNEAFNLGLHAPVTEFHLTEFVGTHDGSLSWVVVVFLYPVVSQGTPLSLD